VRFRKVTTFDGCTGRRDESRDAGKLDDEIDSQDCSSVGTHAHTLPRGRSTSILIAGAQASKTHFTGEELQVKFLGDSEENSLKY
jgi:hypothetical protein